ncbi:MAG: DUF5009 domain-containing protein [Saprospiraceae bacterium]
MKQRLLSLDVFRGMTIALMILVNNPGSWSTVYPPLLHADWHGVTPTDWVFPFFLFIVGVAIPLALGKRKERGDAHAAIIKKILGRVAIIFGLGLFLAAYPKFGISDEQSGIRSIHYVILALFMVAVFVREAMEDNVAVRKVAGIVALAGIAGMVIIGFMAYDFSRLRIPGVLQRIALVYGACGILYLKANWRTQAWVGVGLLLLYWFLMMVVPVPGIGPANLEPETNLGAWFDNLILKGHMYSQTKVWDPEGFLSTLPAIVTGIIGMLTGTWLKTEHDHYKKVAGLLAVGVILLALANVWDLNFPINKKIWTSSYVLYTGGVAMLILGVIYWLADIQGYQKWTRPFVIYGTNALFVYVMSGLVVKTLIAIKWVGADGNAVNALGWIYDTFYTPVFSNPYNASLAYALSNVLFFFGLAWVLHRAKIFIKV